MAFTDTTSVRLHGQLNDTELVSDDLVDQRITDAHNDVLRDLKSEYASSSDAVLKTGETEIATAYVLRSLANRAASEGRDLRTGDFRIDNRGGAAALRAQADAEEQRGWRRLAPYLRTAGGAFRFGLVEPAEPGDADFDPNVR